MKRSCLAASFYWIHHKPTLAANNTDAKRWRTDYFAAQKWTYASAMETREPTYWNAKPKQTLAPCMCETPPLGLRHSKFDGGVNCILSNAPKLFF